MACCQNCAKRDEKAKFIRTQSNAAEVQGSGLTAYGVVLLGFLGYGVYLMGRESKADNPPERKRS